MRPWANFPLSSSPSAISILCVARWRSARVMIEWMCSQERPGCRHHIWRGGTLPPDYSWQQPIMTRIRIIQRFWGRFAPAPALWRASSSYRPVRAMTVRKCSKCCQLFLVIRGRALFVRGVMHQYFAVGPSRQREAMLVVWL